MGGCADAALAGDGTGHGGFGHSQLPGNVVDGQIGFECHKKLPCELWKRVE